MLLPNENKKSVSEALDNQIKLLINSLKHHNAWREIAMDGHDPDISFPEVDYAVDVIGNDEFSVRRWDDFYAV